MCIRCFFLCCVRCCRGLVFPRAATSSRSSVKLDTLLRDMEDTLRRDGTSKFVIFSQYTQVSRGERAGGWLFIQLINSFISSYHKDESFGRA